jgi:hypothetical protein
MCPTWRRRDIAPLAADLLCGPFVSLILGPGHDEGWVQCCPLATSPTSIQEGGCLFVPSVWLWGIRRSSRAFRRGAPRRGPRSDSDGGKGFFSKRLHPPPPTLPLPSRPQVALSLPSHVSSRHITRPNPFCARQNHPPLPIISNGFIDHRGRRGVERILPFRSVYCTNEHPLFTPKILTNLLAVSAAGG